MTEGMDHTSSKSDSKKTSSPRNRYAFIGAIIGIAFIRICRDEGSSFGEVLTRTLWGFLFGLMHFFITKTGMKVYHKTLDKKLDIEKTARIGLVICTLTGVMLGGVTAFYICFVCFFIFLFNTRRKVNKEVKRWRKAAELGNVEAMFNLG